MADFILRIHSSSKRSKNKLYMLTEAEKYLVGAIQKGDPLAFKMLFDSYYSDLCRFAKKYVNVDEDAEDQVQELFVKIWEQPNLLAVTISLKSYMYRSIHNSCMNYITRTHLRFSNLDPVTINRLNELTFSAPEDSPETGLLTSELNAEIKKAVRLFPLECGKIFMMSREEGLTHKEIAQKLKISENTVKVQIYRALARLREELAEYL